MSYDLFFRAPAGTLPPLSALRDWFSRRPHYEVSDGRVGYDNEATGVYFSFDLSGEGGPSFNLNYFRPSYFGLEAAPELAALVEAFGFDVDDPQADGMGEGPFTIDGFLRGWNAGNRFAYAAISGHDPSVPHLALPQETNRRVWAWNRSREAYMDLLGSVEMIVGFAPRIFLLVDPSEPDRVLRATIWPEAMPCAMPEADVVLAMDTPDRPPRVIDQAALRPMLDRFTRRGPDHEFDLDGVRWSTGLAHWLLDYDEPPEDVIVAHQQGGPRELQGVPPDRVLDRELLDAAG